MVVVVDVVSVSVGATGLLHAAVNAVSTITRNARAQVPRVACRTSSLECRMQPKGDIGRGQQLRSGGFPV